jgi:hypothetical protein
MSEEIDGWRRGAAVQPVPLETLQPTIATVDLRHKGLGQAQHRVAPPQQIQCVISRPARSSTGRGMRRQTVLARENPSK